MLGVILPNNTVLTVFNLYGWTNGSSVAAQLQRTNSMLEIIFEEIAASPSGPIIVLGDLNASTIDLTPMAIQIEAGNYIDIGAHADVH
eukprot:3392257-Karenia_brevis.AAC.1